MTSETVASLSETQSMARRRAVVTWVGVWAITIMAVRFVIAPSEHCPTPSATELTAGIDAAIGWFETNQMDDGTWLYEYDAASDEVADDYNIVRHAGVTMSLYQAAAHGNRHALDLADAGSEWALARMRRFEDRAAFHRGGGDISTGATALLVAGLAERRQTTGDPRFDDDLRAMGRFLANQTTDRGQHLAYADRSSGEPIPGRTSIYYTGEAAWAMARLHIVFPTAGFDAPVRRIAHYVATERDEVEDLFPPLRDHWISYTIDAMTNWPEDGVLGDDELAYVRRLADLFAPHVRTEAQTTGTGLARFTRPLPSRAAALGTTSEGLGALWRAARRTPPLADLVSPLEELQLCSASVLLRRQVTEAQATPYARPAAVQGAWLHEGVTRMDDQQHALSGLLSAVEILGARS